LPQLFAMTQNDEFSSSPTSLEKALDNADCLGRDDEDDEDGQPPIIQVFLQFIEAFRLLVVIIGLDNTEYPCTSVAASVVGGPAPCLALPERG